MRSAAQIPTPKASAGGSGGPRFRERVLAALVDWVVRGRGEHAAALAGAAELRMKADYSQEDLTEAGRSLRAQVAPVLKFCRKLVDTAAGGG